MVAMLDTNTAIAYGLKLITRDQHFSNIDFLNVEFWK